MTAYETRITRMTVAPEGEPLFSEQATHIEIDDEGGGEFVKIVQPSGSADIRIDADEWPVIRAAIDKMVDAVRRDAGPRS